MCISTGKYTVNGQNPSDPRNARMSLKKGIAIASMVAKITNIVLPLSLSKLKLKIVLLPILMGYSPFTKLELGHFALANDSNFLYTG